MALPVMTISDIEGNIAPSVNVGILVAPPISDAPISQVIYLLQGWSIISSYIDTTQLINWDDDNFPNTGYSDPFKISDILKQFLYKLDDDNVEYNVWATSQAEFIANVIIVKDGIGAAYLPQWDFDGIHGLKFTNAGLNIAGVFQGLQIKMLNAGYYIKLNGYAPTFLSSETINFPMINGWSVIGYPSQQPISIVTFFENFPTEDLAIVKDYLGNAYLPEWGFNGIDNLQPGEGYQVRINNWTSGDTFVAKIFGQTVNPTIDEEDEVNDDVVVIDDAIHYSDISMVIKIPGDLIVPVIDIMNTHTTLDVKKGLLLGYLNPQIQDSDVLLQEITPSKQANNDAKSSNISVFESLLAEYLIQFSVNDEPSGYSKEVQNLINLYWNIHSLHKDKFGNTLLYNFHEELKKETITLTFFAFSDSKALLVGKASGVIKNLKLTKEIVALTVQGDDALTTSVVEGLIANEIPKLYLFTGEKYMLITPTLVSGTLQFVSLKEVQISVLGLGEELITPL